MVQHFPIAEVAGDSHHAFAGGQRLLEHIQAFDFTNQIEGTLGRPDPGAGAFGQGLADILQGCPDQAFARRGVHFREALGQVDPDHLT
ncbi:hypothetical protein D3C86_1666970 [compost metagenome]